MNGDQIEAFEWVKLGLSGRSFILFLLHLVSRSRGARKTADLRCSTRFGTSYRHAPEHCRGLRRLLFPRSALCYSTVVAERFQRDLEDTVVGASNRFSSSGANPDTAPKGLRLLALISVIV